MSLIKDILLYVVSSYIEKKERMKGKSRHCSGSGNNLNIRNNAIYYVIADVIV